LLEVERDPCVANLSKPDSRFVVAFGLLESVTELHVTISWRPG